MNTTTIVDGSVMTKLSVILNRTVRIEQGAVIELELPDAVIEAIKSNKQEVSKAGWTLAEMYFERANLGVIWSEVSSKPGEIRFALPLTEDSATLTRNVFADLLSDGDNYEADENPFFSRSNEDDHPKGDS